MNDFEEFNVTPELTLDPFQEEKKETPKIYQEAEPETPEIVLTPEERIWSVHLQKKLISPIRT